MKTSALHLRKIKGGWFIQGFILESDFDDDIERKSDYLATGEVILYSVEDKTDEFKGISSSALRDSFFMGLK